MSAWADGSEVLRCGEVEWAEDDILQKSLFFDSFSYKLSFIIITCFIRFNIWPNNKQLSVAQQSSSTIRAAQIQIEGNFTSCFHGSLTWRTIRCCSGAGVTISWWDWKYVHNFFWPEQWASSTTGQCSLLLRPVVTRVSAMWTLH